MQLTSQIDLDRYQRQYGPVIDWNGVPHTEKLLHIATSVRTVIEAAAKMGADARANRIPLWLNPYSKIPYMNDVAHGWNSGWIAEDVMRRNKP